MSLRVILTTLSCWLFAVAPTMAAEEAHEGLTSYALEVFRIGPLVVTNSMIMVWISAAVIILVAQLATRDLKLVPAGLQNFVEWLVESLYNFLEGILGKHLVKRTFWFYGTIFILILFTNWFGLIPGVGTIGSFNEAGFNGNPHDTFHAYLRGGNADVNMTAAMALTFAVLWFYWAITENGLKGFIAHIFAPKGQFKGFMLILMWVIFLFVGVIEVASIMIRPVALTFRLFGNIFAGENILENMMGLANGKWYIAWLPALPFYFLELLVGLIQALVFMLLTSVFLKLICDHGHDEAQEPH